MKGIKYISILLLVSFSVLVGHNMVPHHHHVASSLHPSSHECPAGNHDQNEKGSCHAFNDVEFVKYSPSKLPIPLGQPVFIFSAISLETRSTHPWTITSCPFLQMPTLAPELAGALSLRGPPQFS